MSSQTAGDDDVESSHRLRISQSLESGELTQDPVASPPTAPVADPFAADPLQIVDMTNDSDNPETNDSNLPSMNCRPAVLRTLIPTEFFGCCTLPPIEITILPQKPPIWDETTIENINFNDPENNPNIHFTGINWAEKCQALQFYLLQKELPPNRRSPIFATLTNVLYGGNSNMCSISRSRERET